jgi:hypothetical protein
MEKPTNEHFGKMTHYIPENNVYVYFRYTDNKTVMVLMNNSNEIKLSKLPVSGKHKRIHNRKDILSDLTFDISKNYLGTKVSCHFRTKINQREKYNN